MESSEAIEQAKNAWGLDFTGQQETQLQKYVDLLSAWAERVRLISRNDRAFIWERHILDGLSILQFLPKEGPLFDMGSGAGLPGLLVKIMRPDLQVHLIEPARMKSLFLVEAIAQLGLKDVSAVRKRSEELVGDAVFRGRFPIGTARAVAQLPQLWKWVEPLLKVGGVFIAMKGPEPLEEFDKETRAGLNVRVEEIVLPVTNRQRSFVWINKTQR